MPSLLILVLAVFFGFAQSTKVLFENHCDYSVQVIRTEYGQTPAEECHLEAGLCFFCLDNLSGANYTGEYQSTGMYFKSGWSGQTLAEFSFNVMNLLIDTYDLSIILGFDMPMKLSPSTGGPTLTCLSKGCPDAYQFPHDDTPLSKTKTGGIFTLTFCP